MGIPASSRGHPRPTGLLGRRDHRRSTHRPQHCPVVQHSGCRGHPRPTRPAGGRGHARPTRPAEHCVLPCQHIIVHIIQCMPGTSLIRNFEVELLGTDTADPGRGPTSRGEGRRSAGSSSQDTPLAHGGRLSAEHPDSSSNSTLAVEDSLEQQQTACSALLPLLSSQMAHSMTSITKGSYGSWYGGSGVASSGTSTSAPRVLSGHRRLRAAGSIERMVVVQPRLLPSSSESAGAPALSGA